MAKDRIIVALDTPDPDEAIGILRQLRRHTRWVKVGHGLVNRFGQASAISLVHSVIPDAQVFVDQKLKDTPDRVAQFARQTADAGAAMLTVHCDGGEAMMIAARQAVSDLPSGNRCKIIGVTLLTSLTHHDLVRFGWFPEFEVSEQVQRTRVNDYVCRYALLAKECGLDGVVASPWEAKMVREACGKNFLIVTPSIRPAEFDHDDQSRCETPRFAISAGADMLVVGRPITNAPRHLGVLAAFRLVGMEVDEALMERDEQFSELFTTRATPTAR